MPSYPFLSDEWLDEARKIRAEYEGKTAPVPHVVRMNLVVTAVPFSDEDILAHLDTSSGELVLDTGHLETQDLKVTVDYDTAKAILIEGNPQAGMQAFMAGKVKVEGDMAKLMALQAAPAAADPNAGADHSGLLRRQSAGDEGIDRAREAYRSAAGTGRDTSAKGCKCGDGSVARWQDRRSRGAHADGWLKFTSFVAERGRSRKCRPIYISRSR